MATRKDRHSRRVFFAMFLPLLLWGLPAVVQAQYSCTTNSGKITIIGYTGVGGAVSIPVQINGFPVTSIGVMAFYLRTGVTSVTVPASVTNIGNGAFGSCSNLAGVSIGSGVTSIGDGAFYDCTRLTSVTIPNTVTSIGEFAFQSCIGLTSVAIGTGVTSIRTWTFFNCYSLTGVTIPSSVTSIGDESFRYCTGLTSVSIGDNVVSIGNYAFQWCVRLPSVLFPRSVTSIGNNAFDSCLGLTGAYFRGNAPSGDSSVFYGDSNSTIYYLRDNTGWESTFGGRPTAQWNPQISAVGASGGTGTNLFGFNVTVANDLTIVVETCTDLSRAAWTPLSTNILTAGSWAVNDPKWTNYPSRIYRLRVP